MPNIIPVKSSEVKTKKKFPQSQLMYAELKETKFKYKCKYKQKFIYINNNKLEYKQKFIYTPTNIHTSLMFQVRVDGVDAGLRGNLTLNLT